MFSRNSKDDPNSSDEELSSERSVASDEGDKEYYRLLEGQKNRLASPASASRRPAQTRRRSTETAMTPRVITDGILEKPRGRPGSRSPKGDEYDPKVAFDAASQVPENAPTRAARAGFLSKFDKDTRTRKQNLRGSRWKIGESSSSGRGRGDSLSQSRSHPQYQSQSPARASRNPGFGGAAFPASHLTRRSETKSERSRPETSLATIPASVAALTSTDTPSASTEQALVRKRRVEHLSAGNMTAAKRMANKSAARYKNYVKQQAQEGGGSMSRDVPSNSSTRASSGSQNPSITRGTATSFRGQSRKLPPPPNTDTTSASGTSSRAPQSSSPKEEDEK